MKLKSTAVFALKVWILTMIMGNLIAFLLLSFFGPSIDLHAPAELMVNILFAMIAEIFATVPFALAFYTGLELMTALRWPVASVKIFQVVLGLFSEVVVFEMIFGSPAKFLREPGAPQVFFYSFLAVLALAVIVVKPVMVKTNSRRNAEPQPVSRKSPRRQPAGAELS